MRSHNLLLLIQKVVEAVQSEGADRPSDVMDTKAEAVKRGKEIAKNKGTQLIIHKQDGSLDEKIQYEQ